MNISISLPDDVEALAVDGYRAGILTGAQVQHLLGLDSRWEVDEILYRSGVSLGYGEKELREDLDALRELPNS